MKSNRRQEIPKITPPNAVGELSHADKKALTTAAHGSDPTHRFHVNASGHDARRDVAASGAPQRMRARQTQGR